MSDKLKERIADIIYTKRNNSALSRAVKILNDPEIKSALSCCSKFVITEVWSYQNDKKHIDFNCSFCNRKLFETNLTVSFNESLPTLDHLLIEMDCPECDDLNIDEAEYNNDLHKVLKLRNAKKNCKCNGTGKITSPLTIADVELKIQSFSSPQYEKGDKLWDLTSELLKQGARVIKKGN